MTIIRPEGDNSNNFLRFYRNAGAGIVDKEKGMWYIKLDRNKKCGDAVYDSDFVRGSFLRGRMDVSETV